MTDLAKAACREVHDLHALFTGWLGRGHGDFGEAAAVLADGFQMVTPDGKLLSRARVLQGLRDAAGRRGADFAIHIDDLTTSLLPPHHVLAVYVERQEARGRATRRRSSALFQAEPSAPRGVVWLHLHETWI